MISSMESDRGWTTRVRLRGSAHLVLGLSMLLAGCSTAVDTLPREAVSGSVSLNKEPLETGVITFDPADPGKPDAVSGAAAIRDGSYSIAKGEGLTPGNYRVSITSIPDGGSDVSLDSPGLPPKARPKDKIPEKYNAKSTLTAEVKADTSNDLNFELSSGK